MSDEEDLLLDDFENDEFASIDLNADDNCDHNSDQNNHDKDQRTADERTRLSADHCQFLQQFTGTITTFPNWEVIDAIAKYLHVDPTRVSRYIKNRRITFHGHLTRPSAEQQTADCDRIMASFDVIMAGIERELEHRKAFPKQSSRKVWQKRDAQLLLDIMAYYAQLGHLTETGFFPPRFEITNGSTGDRGEDAWIAVCRWFKHLGGPAHLQKAEVLNLKLKMLRKDYYAQRALIRKRYTMQDGRLSGESVEKQRLMEQELEELKFSRMKQGRLSNGQPATYENLRALYAAEAAAAATVTADNKSTSTNNFSPPSRKDQTNATPFPTPQTPGGHKSANANILLSRDNLLYRLLNSSSDKSVRTGDDRGEQEPINEHADSNCDDQQLQGSVDEPHEPPPSSPKFLPDMQLPPVMTSPKRPRSDSSTIIPVESNSQPATDLKCLQTCVRFVEGLQFADPVDFRRALKLVEESQNIFYCLSESGRIRFLKTCDLSIIIEE